MGVWGGGWDGFYLSFWGLQNRCGFELGVGLINARDLVANYNSRHKTRLGLTASDIKAWETYNLSGALRKADIEKFGLGKKGSLGEASKFLGRCKLGFFWANRTLWRTKIWGESCSNKAESAGNTTLCMGPPPGLTNRLQGAEHARKGEVVETKVSNHDRCRSPSAPTSGSGRRTGHGSYLNVSERTNVADGRGSTGEVVPRGGPKGQGITRG